MYNHFKLSKNPPNKIEQTKFRLIRFDILLFVSSKIEKIIFFDWIMDKKYDLF